ncbi:MAG: aconitate hydratase AcnA, partial [Bacteroidota bacterium]|nr:aconitate hydratase AcnA [Candidatus Kapabacteria bacterium]MDW8221121.1 aconitate hydratase AcnA [Bacteroidota bacterium]
ARVLMQDFTGVPAVVDIASIRAEYARKGGHPDDVNPLIPVDLVIDHSVMVDYYGTPDALAKNVQVEYERNMERYRFLKWAQNAFRNFSVVPPGMGICHQVNLEYLAQGVIARDGYAFPDTLVGTDSHTPMVNGIGVVGWGVGGIEAEAALLGQPSFFLIPEVIGLRLTGKLPIGTTATDLVLTVTRLLRDYGVVNKFVEVFGPGLDNLAVTDRATISNMSPEFGCTITYFPIDDRTLEYLRKSGRSPKQVDLVEQYTKANMLWRENEDSILYTHVLELDMSTVEPTVAGPKRPQDKVLMRNLKSTVATTLDKTFSRKYLEPSSRKPDQVNGYVRSLKVEGADYTLDDGSVVIAAITSCTNTSNPDVMIGAGLLAKKAVEKGLQVKPWVKTSLAPGSKVVTEYLKRANVLEDLEKLRFHVTGYGCTTCIGNSGPLDAPIAAAIDKGDLAVAAALSGNRNFEARVHNQVKMNFLMSPMLVVAFALAGRVDIDMETEPLGIANDGTPVFLKDIWPSNEEIHAAVSAALKTEDFITQYGSIFAGGKEWQELQAPTGKLFEWDARSTYIKESPFFKDLPAQPSEPQDILGARALLVLGDMITTDHISPAGSFKETSPAGKYLLERGVKKEDFNSYGARRGHDEVMIRGTFANVRIKNALADREGGYTTYLPSNELTTVYEAAMRYKADGTPLIVIAGKEYGSGSSRDWAAKGTALLGIRVVLAESYERIHRANLVGMGVLPLQFKPGQNAASLGLTGREIFDILGISKGLVPLETLTIKATRDDGTSFEFQVDSRIDNKIEVEYYKHGGILQYVLRQFLARKTA